MSAPESPTDSPDSASPISAADAASRQQLTLDAAARRMRDRYIAARFLQLPDPRAALRNTGDMLRWARQMVEDDKAHQAAELMMMSLEEDSSQRPIWLFLFDLAFLARDGSEFSELLAGFEARFAEDAELPTIYAMGAALLPNDARFAGHPPLAESPRWSEPALGDRNEALQQKLHRALQEIAAHIGGPR